MVNMTATAPARRARSTSDGGLRDCSAAILAIVLSTPSGARRTPKDADDDRYSQSLSGRAADR